MENGLDQQELVKYNLGPVAFHEEMNYFREVFPGKPVSVSLQLKGLSEDGMYFQFLHNFYDQNGRNIAHCKMMGGWIDLDTRKLTGLPKDLLNKFETFDKTDDFQVLTKSDTRKAGVFPQDLDLS